MKVTIDENYMKEAFERYDRDYYTVEGLTEILLYYDGIDENTEFDVIQICCDWTEYGEGENVLSFDDMITSYSYLLDIEEWLDENALTKNDFEKYKFMYIESLVEVLEFETIVLHASNDNYIVLSF